MKAQCRVPLPKIPCLGVRPSRSFNIEHAPSFFKFARTAVLFGLASLSTCSMRSKTVLFVFGGRLFRGSTAQVSICVQMRPYVQFGYFYPSTNPQGTAQKGVAFTGKPTRPKG